MYIYCMYVCVHVYVFDYLFSWVFLVYFSFENHTLIRQRKSSQQTVFAKKNRLTLQIPVQMIPVHRQVVRL